MGASKITQLHVYIIGAVLLLLVGLGMYFLMLKPLNEANAALRADRDSKDQAQTSIDGKSFTIAQVAQAQKALTEARVRKVKAERELKALEIKKQLPAGKQLYLGKDQDTLIGTSLPRWLTLPKTVVNTMENYAQTSAKKFGVKVVTAFAAPAPSTNPGTIPTDIVAWALGGMSVTGEFNKVMAWVENWNNSPLLASVEGLKLVLAGRDGQVSAACGLVVYVFPTGPGANKNVQGGGADPNAMGGMGMGGAMGGPGYSDMPGGGPGPGMGGGSAGMMGGGGGSAGMMGGAPAGGAGSLDR